MAKKETAKADPFAGQRLAERDDSRWRLAGLGDVHAASRHHLGRHLAMGGAGE